MYHFFQSLWDRVRRRQAGLTPIARPTEELGQVPADAPVPDKFRAVARHIEQLRELERQAAADPGYENWDTDHVTTAAYDRYESAWGQLHDLIHAGPLPDIWFWFHAWLQQDNPAFGDVDGTTYPDRRCRWSPAARSLRTVLLKSIERRAYERLSRPEDEPLWKDPRFELLLASLAPTPPAEGGPQVAAILALLTPLLQIEEGGLNPGVRRRLEELRAQAARFEYRGLQIAQEGEVVCVRLDFANSLANGDEVWLHLTDRDSRRTFWQLTVRLRQQTAQKLVPWKPHDPPIDIRVKADQVELRFPAQQWREELEVSPGTVLSMDIRFAGAGFLAGCVPAPEVTVASPWPRCSRCRELTPVVVDGEFCPACRVARLSANRPIGLADAPRLEQVRRQWSNAACPKCGARRFARRFPEFFSGEFRCEQCQSDWGWKDGKFVEPGPVERQWLALAQALYSIDVDFDRGWVREATLHQFDAALEQFKPAHLTRPLRKSVRRAKERLSACATALRAGEKQQDAGTVESAEAATADRVLQSVLRTADFLKRASGPRPESPE